MTQTEEHLTGDGIQVQDDISITIRPAAAWMRNLEQLPLRCRCFRRFTTERN